MRTMIFLAVLLMPTITLAAEPLTLEQQTIIHQRMMLEQERSRLQQMQLEFQRQMYEAQVQAAREQALGLMLFGTGPALINGMNQGFNNMRVAPPIPSR